MISFVNALQGISTLTTFSSWNKKQQKESPHTLETDFPPLWGLCNLSLPPAQSISGLTVSKLFPYPLLGLYPLNDLSKTLPPETFIWELSVP